MKKLSLKQRKVLWLLVGLVCAGMLVYNAVVLIRWSLDRKGILQETGEIEGVAGAEEIEDDENTELVNPPTGDSDYWYYVGLPLTNVVIGELKKINPDTVGFLSVAGTNINYPVVQTTNNEYYLTRSFKKAVNSAGWIFMDYRNDANFNDKNTIVYGHGRLDRIMFSTLKNILSTTWVKNKDNYVVRYSSEKENMLFQVFSVYTVPTESYYIQTDFVGESLYQEWLDVMIGRSMFDFGTSVNTGDKILTLSTCKDNNGENKVVMHAKLIKKSKK